MCQNSTEENKRRYKSIKNNTNNEVSKAMREKTVGCQNVMSRIVKGSKTDSKEVEGGRCMRGSDGKLYFSE